MFTEEQIKAIIQENERLRKENDALSGKVASLEQSLYWLRKKMFGRMSEKNLPLDPNSCRCLHSRKCLPMRNLNLRRKHARQKKR